MCALRFNSGLSNGLLVDRQKSFRGGVDAFSEPTLVPADGSEWAVNCWLSDNFRWRTRPGSAGLGGTTAGSGPVQGLFYYDTPNTEQVLRAVGGSWQYWNGSLWTSASGGPAHATNTMAADQLVETLYVSDGSNPWKSWNGSAWTELASAGGVVSGQPISDPPQGATIVLSHQGRIWAAGVSAQPDTLWGSNVLEAGAGKWDHVNMSFRVGQGEGDKITALRSLPKGWLFVGKENSVWIGQTPASVAQATNFTFERQSLGIGPVGPRAACVNGSDVWFYAEDGLRSLKRMAATDESWEVSAPVSIPIQPYLDRITEGSKAVIAVERYKHLIFLSVPLDGATANSTTFVYNLRLGCWMGEWEWAAVCFCVSRFSGVSRLLWGDASGRANAFLDYADQADADNYKDNGVEYASSAKFRRTDFGVPESTKTPHFGTVRFLSTQNTVTLRFYFDGTLDLEQTEDITSAGITFPITFPVTMPNPKPATVRKSARTYRGPSLSVDHPAQARKIQRAFDLALEVRVVRGFFVVRDWTLAALENVMDESETSDQT